MPPSASRRSSRMIRSSLFGDIIQELLQQIVRETAGDRPLLRSFDDDHRGRLVHLLSLAFHIVRLDFIDNRWVLSQGLHFGPLGGRESACDGFKYFTIFSPGRLILEKRVSDLLVLADPRGSAGISGCFTRVVV